MKYLNLFVDESGQSNPMTANSGVYVLSGCVIDNIARDELKTLSNQVKYKFWERTDVVLHSREIGRKEGDFTILKDPGVQKSFERNLFRILNFGGYRMFFVLVDLNKAKKQNWKEGKIYQETTRIIVKNFILALLAIGNCRGRIVIESATSKKDLYYHDAVNYYLSGGISSVGADYKDVQKVLTEISFVTKKNHDIEEQLADLLAYGARLKFEKRKLTSTYETSMLSVVNSKIFAVAPGTGAKKSKFHSKIDSFKILP